MERAREWERVGYRCSNSGWMKVCAVAITQQLECFVLYFFVVYENIMVDSCIKVFLGPALLL
jgi:nicotinamide riboside transporter PnuC